jgi:hypothetical protein
VQVLLVPVAAVVVVDAQAAAVAAAAALSACFRSNTLEGGLCMKVTLNIESPRFMNNIIYAGKMPEPDRR